MKRWLSLAFDIVCFAAIVILLTPVVLAWWDALRRALTQEP